MMRSLFSGVSGLKTHQTRMDVIGNNIANVNTVAFKSSSMTFASLMSQTTQRASGANELTGTGGVNARQIGLGVKTSAINTNITGQGASQSTGNPFDIMITGENFFIVSDGSNNYFTRDGSFYVDGAGNLAMTSIGYNVMGWQAEEDPVTGELAIKKDTVSALRIMSSANMTYPPAATTDAYMSGIIDKFDPDVSSEGGRTVNLNFYDAQGYVYTAKFAIKQSDDPSVYSMELERLIDSGGNSVDITGAVFGKNGTKQTIAGEMMLETGYTWAKGLLQKADGGGTITVADLADIIENNDIKALTAEAVQADPTATPPVEAKTVEDVLNEIADAYGFNGSAKEFLNLIVPVETTPATATDPAVMTDFSIRQLLLSQGDVTITTQDGTNVPAVLGTADYAAGEVINTSGRYFDGVTINFDTGNGTFQGLNGGTASTAIFDLSNINTNGNFTSITMDFSTISNVNNKGTSTIGATNGKDDAYNTGSGRMEGAMSGVSIQQNGMIYATYDNGMTKLLGQIATAKFANASGLEKLADNLYNATLNSGSFDGIGVDITADGDYMSTGMLEMSNVDLSSEFTEMITTQRGFQANSRIITVSDTLLEELTNLKR